jgi:hypothetical protein
MNLNNSFKKFEQVTEDDGVEGKAIVAEAGIRGFPTFLIFINGTKRDELSGCNPTALSEMVAKYHAMVPRSFEGSGFSLGGGGGKLFSGLLVSTMNYFLLLYSFGR